MGLSFRNRLCKHSDMSTLKDVAQKAGVSVPTVSRVLNPKGSHISARPETIQRIRDAADELNYTPNAAARSLITSCTRNIALLLDSARDNPKEDFYWAPIIRGITKQCTQDQLGCLFSVEHYHEGGHFDIPICIREKKIDGFIATHPVGMRNTEFIDNLLRTQMPFVVLSFCSSDPRVWSVFCDPASGYREACRHLAELGHKRVGYMVDAEWKVAEYRLPWSPEQVTPEDLIFSPVTIDLSEHHHTEIAEKIAHEIASGELDITAIIMGDIIGIDLISRLAEKGIRVPEDFSIIGFDDSYACTLSRPRLTSIHSPLEEMGAAAVSMLSERIKVQNSGQPIAARHLSIPKSFTLGDSTGPAPDAN